MLDAELKVLKPDTLPPSLRSLPQTLSITNEKALVLILSLHALLKEYIAVGMQDENELAERFPEEFPKKIKTFLFKMMREVAETSKVYLQDEFTSLPKMRDFDCFCLDQRFAAPHGDCLGFWIFCQFSPFGQLGK